MGEAEIQQGLCRTGDQLPHSPAAIGVHPMALPDGTVRYVLKLGPKGRVLLPASVRAAMGLAEGDIILGWLKDGKLTLESWGSRLEEYSGAELAARRRTQRGR